jgi:hypothetical protein
MAAGGQPGLAAGKAYTVGKYPVEAAAENAVAAKEKALADGRQAAFRSLLKRLVPVTAYQRLAEVKRVDAAGLLEGVAVRSETNSATQYIASLDFSFQSQPVRDLLRREGIPLVDEQSPPIVLLPVYVTPSSAQGPAPPALGPSQGSRTWKEVWAGLDLDNALTPIRLDSLKASVTPQQLQALAAADEAALAALARSYSAEFLVIAKAEPDLVNKRLNVTLAGRDAVNFFVLDRTYRLAVDDFAYAAELAAVIALGTLEGRWKAYKLAAAPGGPDAYARAPALVQLSIEFRNMQQWQEIRRMITGIRGVGDLDVIGLSARSAEVTLTFPGGEEALAERLMGQGLHVDRLKGTLLVRPAI